VKLPGEYEGFKFKLWVNAPSSLWSVLLVGSQVDELGEDASEDEEAAQAAAAAVKEAELQGVLQKLVLEHNGWRDFEGETYPQPSEVAFWEIIPTELAACVIAASQVEMRKLPNSIASRKRRSRRG
jgi:hypothetical protein